MIEWFLNNPEMILLTLIFMVVWVIILVQTKREDDENQE